MGMENEYDVAERVQKQLDRDREKFDEGYRVGYREGYNKAKDERKLLKEEKGDLISREAWKNDLKQYFSDGVLDSVSAKLAFNMILRKIYEAPSVDIKDQIAGAYNEGYMCGNKEAEKSRTQGEWIPVSERLPDTSGHKIVCFVKPQRIDNIYIGLAYFDNGRWVGYIKKDIIAWQPLPEPYKEGGAEND